jgi:hypothetical protein
MPIPHGIFDIDRVKPAVAMTSPGSGATVSGVITVAAAASDNDQIASVQLQLDGGNLGAPDTVAPYQTTYDTMALSNGGHSVGAVALDRVGNSSSASSGFTVSNTPPGVPPQPGPTGTIGDWVVDPNDPASWDAGGGQYGSFGPLSNFALWTGKGFTFQVRSYMSYHADSKTAVCRLTLNDGGSNYWFTGAIYGGGYAGDYAQYSGWWSVPALGWSQIRGRIDVTREIGGDYFVVYHYTQIEFQWV